MVPSLPVTPAPALTAPFTGGQMEAQLPLQLEAVEVSGANQYRVKPLLLVSTVAPITFAVVTVAPPAAEGEAGPPDVVVPDEPQAAATKAIATSPAGASDLIRMA